MLAPQWVDVAGSSARPAKLIATEPIGKDKLQASRHRKVGFASARLLLLARDDFEINACSNNLHWILMRTDGDLNSAAQDAREFWKNLKDTKIEIDGLELIRLYVRHIKDKGFRVSAMVNSELNRK